MKTTQALRIAGNTLRTVIESCPLTPASRQHLLAARRRVLQLKNKAEHGSQALTWTHHEGYLSATVTGGQWLLQRLPQHRTHCLIIFCDATGAMIWQHGEALTWKRAAALVTRMQRALARDYGALLSLAEKLATRVC